MSHDSKKDLEKLSKGWKFDPPDQKTWLENESARIGVRAGDLEKAFTEEFSRPHALSEDFEIPDVMKITYRYSLGGQSPFFRALRDYGKLLGARCDACDFTYCPPRKNCSRCYGDTHWIELPGTGKVETFTHIYKGPLVKGVPRLICAYIRLDGSNFVMMANIEMDDPSKAEVGMPVKVVMKKERVGRITDFFFTPA